MHFSNCRDEIIYTVTNLIAKDSFTINEVISLMKNNNTCYKESTIRTHISSRCCVNAPNNHGSVYNDFERVGTGVYRLSKINYKPL